MKNKHNNSSNKLISAILAVVVVVALVLISFVAIGEQQKAQGAGTVIRYDAVDTQKPHVQSNEMVKDIGTMKVTDERTVQFTITNTGNKALQLFNVTTSCGCTLGEITINGETSPQFGMHSKNDWVGVVNSGEQAVVSLIYKPSVMPVKGNVTRSVMLSTNDPENQELTFTIKTNVE